MVKNTPGCPQAMASGLSGIHQHLNGGIIYAYVVFIWGANFRCVEGGRSFGGCPFVFELATGKKKFSHFSILFSRFPYATHTHWLTTVYFTCQWATLSAWWGSMATDEGFIYSRWAYGKPRTLNFCIVSYSTSAIELFFQKHLLLLFTALLKCIKTITRSSGRTALHTVSLIQRHHDMSSANGVSIEAVEVYENESTRAHTVY